MSKQSKNRAVFLDRDGVINKLIYYPEHGIVDSPFTAAQFRLLPNAAAAIRGFREMGFKAVIVSNQPGIAKGYISKEGFTEIREKMAIELAAEKAALDGEYYCLHHPQAVVEELKAVCNCRKPRPGLLIQAAEEMDIDLGRSWMIGDGLTDIAAGVSAGCKTALIGRMKCELCHLMEEHDAYPDIIALDLAEVLQKMKGPTKV